MPSESLTTFSVIPVTTCGDERRNVMAGTELEFVRLEEGSFGTSPSSSSSSSLSLPQSLEATLQIHSEDEEIQPPVLVRVEAPATLAEGYVFGATTTTTTSDDTNGTHSYESSLSSSNQSTRVPVRVPPGGVAVGETLTVPLLPHRLEEQYSFNFSGSDDSTALDPDDANHGKCKERTKTGASFRGNVAAPRQWKDGLCSCFRLGLCHPHLLNAWLCPQILLGQILVRMDLTRLAHHLTDSNSDTVATSQPEISDINYKQQSTTQSGQRDPRTPRASPFGRNFRIIFGLIFAVDLYVALYGPNANNNADYPNDYFWWKQLFYFSCTIPMSLWGLVVVIRLRRAIRERYQIPPVTLSVPSPCSSSSEQCNLSLGNSEDLVCGLCCGFCVLSQMARQTADYEGTEPAAICTANGLVRRSSSNIDNDDGSRNEEASLPLQHGNGDIDGDKKRFSLFQRLVTNLSSHSKEKSLVTTTAPLSPSHSLSNGNNHLRQRLPSSSPCTCRKPEDDRRNSLSQ